MADEIDKGLADCSEGWPYGEGSFGEIAREAAYAVLRCCNLITAGDNRVPERIARTAQHMLISRSLRQKPEPKPRDDWTNPQSAETAKQAGRYSYLHNKRYSDNPFNMTSEFGQAWAGGFREMTIIASEFPPSERCHASRDGEVCNFAKCPQLRDGESHKSGRHCPLDKRDEDDDR